MTAPEYCRDCGVYLAGGMVDRARSDWSLCADCEDDTRDDAPEYESSRQSICNGTCDTCDCEVWTPDP